MKKIWFVLSVWVISVSFVMAEGKTLIEAVKNGDLEEAMQMVKVKESLDAGDAQGQTPLMCAAVSGNIEMVQLLVEAGADINAQDKKGFTVIDWLEGTLRRLNMNTPEYKQKRMEQMRREGFSEEIVQKDIQMIENSAPSLQKSPADIRNLQRVLGYLKQVKEAKDKSNGERVKPPAGSANGVEGSR